MKRSTKVVLTLLVPAMAAFGCGQSPTMYQSPGTHQTASDCDTPAKPGEPPKTNCPPGVTHRSHYGSSRSSWFGGTHSGSASSALSHGSSGSGNVSHGGFGSSGFHFSGGS